MNQEKIRHAAAATDVILDGCNRALQALQASLYTNGAGVLSDPLCAVKPASRQSGDRPGARCHEQPRWLAARARLRMSAVAPLASQTAAGDTGVSR